MNLIEFKWWIFAISSINRFCCHARQHENIFQTCLTIKSYDLHEEPRQHSPRLNDLKFRHHPKNFQKRVHCDLACVTNYVVGLTRWFMILLFYYIEPKKRIWRSWFLFNMQNYSWNNRLDDPSNFSCHCFHLNDVKWIKAQRSFFHFYISHGVIRWTHCEWILSVFSFTSLSFQFKTRFNCEYVKA